MSDDNPDREIALARLQYDHQLARLGLQGTLWDAWASLIAIVTIAVVQVAINRYVIEGWAFAAMVAVIVVPVTFYGAYIFNRTLSISAQAARDGGSFSASSSDKTTKAG
jgi:hypothetical protein